MRQNSATRLDPGMPFKNAFQPGMRGMRFFLETVHNPDIQTRQTIQNMVTDFHDIRAIGKIRVPEPEAVAQTMILPEDIQLKISNLNDAVRVHRI